MLYSIMKGLWSLCSPAEEIALLLEGYLDYPAATWLHLQHAYDPSVAVMDLPPSRLQSIRPLAKIQSA